MKDLWKIYRVSENNPKTQRINGVKEGRKSVLGSVKDDFLLWFVVQFSQSFNDGLKSL